MSCQAFVRLSEGILCYGSYRGLVCNSHHQILKCLTYLEEGLFEVMADNKCQFSSASKFLGLHVDGSKHTRT